MRLNQAKSSGFSIIELMVVLAIISVLLTLVVPRYTASVQSTKEAVLKENLSAVRRAIDQHLADTGELPKTLEQLVEKRYLRSLPFDPLVYPSNEWTLISSGKGKSSNGDGNSDKNEKDTSNKTAQGIEDIRSTSTATGKDGTVYATW